MPKREFLLAIDPGVRKLGAAVFSPDGELLACRTIESGSVFGLVRELRALVEAVVPRWGVLDTVVERMVKYKSAPAMHADLDRVEATTKAIADLWPWRRPKRVTPEKWKAQVPKPVFRRRILGTLSLEEATLLPPEEEHDPWDAVGIGLVTLGRLKRGGVS